MSFMRKRPVIDKNSLPYSEEIHWRFNAFIDFGHHSECWLWKGNKVTSKHSPDYKWGVFWIKDRNFKASRVSWMLNVGAIPPGMKVLHLCDNPLCVNLWHLYLGTQKENVEDMDSRGRRVTLALSGERHGRSTLTNEQASSIKNSTEMGTVLARRFGVSPTVVCDIRRGRTWRQIT